MTLLPSRTATHISHTHDGHRPSRLTLACRQVLILVTLVLVPAHLPAQEEVPEAARALIEEAQQAQNAGRDTDAIAKYNEVIERVPSAATAYIGLGAIYYKRGDAAKAYDIFTRGLARAPESKVLLSNSAAAALQIGKAEEALGYADRAVERSRNDADLYALRSSIFRALNHPQEALGDIQQAIRFQPDEAKNYFNLGNLLYQLGRKDESIEAYRKAIDRDRKYVRAWYNLGAVLYDTEKYDEALKAYRIALEPIESAFAKGQPVEPLYARAYLNLGGIYFKQKQWKPALDAYQKALRLDPNDVAGYYNSGFIYFTIGDTAKAEQVYRSALKLDPTLPLARYHLGLITFRRGDDAEAVKSLEEALPKLDAEARHDALKTLGHARLRLGNRSGADEAYKQAVEADHADVASLLGLAKIARMTNDAPAEKRYLLQVLQHEDLWQAHASLASLLLREGAIGEARIQLDAALHGNVDPAVRPSLDAMRTAFAAAAALNAGDGPAAAILLQPYATRDAATRANLGLALWLAGKNDEARPHLAAAVQAFPQLAAPRIALGAIELTQKNYTAAVQSLDACKAKRTPTTGMILGSDAELCVRAQQWLAEALVGAAAHGGLEARAQLDRALALPLDAKTKAIALLLRGNAALAENDTEAARNDLQRALAAGLPPALMTNARANLAVAQQRQGASP
jgi:tetratricopeptide (TPR) repeat protein